MGCVNFMGKRRGVCKIWVWKTTWKIQSIYRRTVHR